MTDYTKLGSTNTATVATGYDAGLRSFMLKVYNYMTLALLISGGVAYFAGTSQEFIEFIVANKVMVYVIMFAPLAIVILFSARLSHMSLQATQGVFWLFSVAMGLSLWFIFSAYTKESIVEAFAVSSATFAGMSLFGYTTKRDLSSMGSFMIMGLWGLIVASIVNLFLHSSGLNFAISLIGVGVFIGLTAYDTQKLKTNYYMTNGDATFAGKAAIFGALRLYLDFINLFLMLLRVMNNRR